MRLAVKTWIAVVAAALLLFVLGFLLTSSIFELLLPQENGVSIIDDPGFSGSYVFAFIFAAIPLCAAIVWSSGHVLGLRKRLLSVVIISVAVLLALVIRHWMIAGLFRKYAALQSSMEGLQASMPYSELRFGTWALGGLIIGSIIAFLTLNRRRQLS